MNMVRPSGRLALDIGADPPGLGLSHQRHGCKIDDDIHPARLARLRRLDDALIVVFHVGDQVGDPVDIVFADGDDVGECRRPVGTAGQEHVGETFDHQPEIGLGAALPLVVDRAAVAALDPERHQRAGERVITGGEDDHVELDLAGLGANAVLGDLDDRILEAVLEVDIGQVVGLVVLGIETGPAGEDRITARLERLCRDRIVDDFIDLAADKFGDLVAGRLVDQEIGERTEEGGDRH